MINVKKKSGSINKYCKEEINLNVIGLMCLPPNDSGEDKYFKQMLDLNQNLGLKELSMGMSGDYLKAIKFGSTFLRIGSAIFGERKTKQ